MEEKTQQYPVWVPLVDRLPHLNGDTQARPVLAWLKSKTGKIEDGTMYILMFRKKEGFDQVEYPACGVLIPTHWAELPKNPTEG